MDSMNQTVIYAAVMLVAGLGIPVMGALNGGLGARMQNPALAASIMLFVGACFSLVFLLSTRGLAGLSPRVSAPWYFYFAGLFVLMYVLSVTWVAPRFGVGNAISFALLGQLLAMTVIDQVGLFGAIQHSLTVQRAVGLVLMAAGVFLVVRRS